MNKLQEVYVVEVPKARKRYSEEFKQQAVQLALSGEYSRRQTAERLGVSYHTLQLWIQQHRQQQQPGALSKEEREELKRLRKENARLQMERDILKKAAWLLGQPSE
jgi:transposase